MMGKAPKWYNDVPLCSHNDCPQYDGKRCKETGFIPDRVCTPQVKIATRALRDIAEGEHSDEAPDIARAALKGDE
jgi:hypothetical protein